MRSWAKFRHDAEKSLLPRSQAIKANSEKILVKTLGYGRESVLHDRQADWRDFGPVPGLITPFLEKVGIALSETVYLPDGGLVELDSVLFDRVLQGSAGVRLGKCANVGKTE